MPTNPLPEQLATQAANIVDTLTETHYQFAEQINESAGIYDCDCNSFVGFILQALAPSHYALLPKEANHPRPRAFEYYNFFSSLPPSSPGGWHRIQFMADGREGDILSWRFANIQVGHDTGHVVFLAETPVVKADSTASVRVYDSANAAHFADTRGSGKGQFLNGVGSGVINFQLDPQGRPIAFQFSPTDTFVTLPIAIGRTEPLA